MHKSEIRIVSVITVGDEAEHQYKMVTFGWTDRPQQVVVPVTRYTDDDNLVRIARANLHLFASSLAKATQDWSGDEELERLLDEKDQTSA